MTPRLAARSATWKSDSNVRTGARRLIIPCSTRRITAVVVTVFEMDASGKTVQTGDRQPLVHVGDAEAANGGVAVLEDAERDTRHVIGGHFGGYERSQRFEDRIRRRLRVRRRRTQQQRAHDGCRDGEPGGRHDAAIIAFEPRTNLSSALDACSRLNSATGGHEHIRLRSPYGLSMRPTDGQ